MRVCDKDRVCECAFVYMCAHVLSMCNRCEINKSCRGMENVLQIATHLFKTSSGLVAENVINTADGFFFCHCECVWEMKPIPDRWIYAVP